MWDECVNEHIIRAIAIFLCSKYVDKEIAEQRTKYEIELGYVYIPYIIEKLNYYEKNREQYRCFSEYYTVLLEAFSENV